MSRGKHLSLEEARKADQLAQFAREHHSVGDEDDFDRLMSDMAAGKPSTKSQTSTRGACED